MKAFITLLSSTNYYDGVVVLKRSLQAVKSQYPLYCALSANVGEHIENSLKKENIETLRLIQHIDMPERISSDIPYAHWNNTFDKLLIWGFTQFEKLVFLDSDLLILNNIDNLFEREAFSGVCAGKSYPGNEDWKGINSGVMVLVPANDVKQALIDLIPTVVAEHRKQNRLIGDQDILQYYLTDKWDDTPSLQLDEGYNIFADFLNYYIKDMGYSWNNKTDKTIYVVHFIGQNKPWMKLSMRKCYWLLKNLIWNPYYLNARRKFRRYLSCK